MGFFGPEKITLTLDKVQFKPGDVIKGMVTLNLRKPLHGRKMTVALLGKVRTTHRDSQGRMQTQDVVVYDFTLPLDGENDYVGESYSFEIHIQNDILQMQTSKQKLEQKLQEKLGTFGAILGEMATMGQGPVRWMVHAQLDVPFKIDVKKTQDIIISS